jgi:hypothetical protein
MISFVWLVHETEPDDSPKTSIDLLDRPLDSVSVIEGGSDLLTPLITIKLSRNYVG